MRLNLIDSRPLDPTPSTKQGTIDLVEMFYALKALNEKPHPPSSIMVRDLKLTQTPKRLTITKRHANYRQKLSQLPQASFCSILPQWFSFLSPMRACSKQVQSCLANSSQEFREETQQDSASPSSRKVDDSRYGITSRRLAEDFESLRKYLFRVSSVFEVNGGSCDTAFVWWAA